MNKNVSVFSLFIGLLGLATLASGLADILVWAGADPGFSIGILEIAGDDFFRWAWGGAIVAFGGLFMLAGLKNTDDLQQSATVLLGAAMVWIIAGTDIFARFCESVPAGEEAPEFFNSLSGFLAGFAPPYPPAILLLPFTLVVAYVLFTRRFDEAEPPSTADFPNRL
ncbi:hypothetical protein FGU65_05385 [Methanoculleus sp. FWC-SCC1]|uniref:Uncharacterized protein n=1 Tax=Methanoculleus frigidifontis TaxID=2584085 RepID=A0ABT8M8S3_9EURY|nr:hypothetical protein [Methanoculleus sp. FWC-SCC1]MDN7024328.1 hypothetical protein [Methanoculleus sp. FWC-SCC1]